MKSPSIDKLYTNINKHILLAQGYTEIKELAFLIKSCRLKPYDFLLDPQNKKLLLHRLWVDEFGNSVTILTNKRLKITYNDLSIKKSNIISTDLYYGLSIDKIVKISKLAHIFVAKDDDNYEPILIITFLGIDNYFRTFMLVDGEWAPLSPLILGINNLKNIIYNRDIKYFKELSIKENIYMPCVLPEAWLTFIPANRLFISLMERKDELIASIINTTKEQ